MDVEEKGGSDESISPVVWRHGCLKQDRAYYIVSRTNGTFNFTIPGRCVWAGETHHLIEREKEVSILGTIRLTSIVALESPNGPTKMHANVSMKVTKNNMHLRFEFEGKSPSIARKIINNQEIVLIP